MGKDTKFIDRIPGDAKEFIEKKKIKVVRNPNQKKGKYTKQNFLMFYDGFDFLQNTIFVRHYMLKKYNIDNQILELLLYIFPLNYFTRKDYQMLVRPFSCMTIDNFVEKGYARVAVNTKASEKKLYTLTITAKNIVTLYYEYLSEKKKLPVDAANNPMAKASANRSDKIRMNLILALQEKEVPDTKKVFFR